MAKLRPPPRWTQWLPLLYLAFGTAWILASDTVVGWLFQGSPHLLLVASTLKGFAFVFLTALVLALWWRSQQRYNATLVEAAEARASFVAERMAWMSRHANDAILLLDHTGLILDCNERAEILYGWTRGELLRKTIYDLRPVAARLETSAQFEHVVREGSLVFEARHVRRDGSEFPVEVSAVGVEFEGHRYVQSVIRDRTELVAARRRLENQRDLYDLLSRCSHAAARVRDRDSLYQAVARLAVEHGRFLFAWVAELQPNGDLRKAAAFGADDGYLRQLEVNARADDVRGRGPAGRSLREGTTVIVDDFLATEMVAPWHAAARRAGIAACASVPFRVRGEVVGALLVYSTERYMFDAPTVATLDEIAEEIGFGLEALETRKELDESRNLLQTVIDASAAPIYVFDREGRLLLINEAGAKLFDQPRERLIGQRRPALLEPAVVAAHQASDDRVLQTGEAVYVEEVMDIAGDERVFLTVKYPLRDLAGHVYAVGGISTEITDLRRSQREADNANVRLEETVLLRTQELTVERDRAEQADRAKTAFLSTISHELRTPLNSIIGFTDIVLQELSGPLNDEQHKQLTMVHDSSRMLLDLINEMLDLSRIEAGRLQLSVESFDLRDLLRRRVEALQPQANAKGLRLDVAIGPDVERMTSDAKRVAQIVTNLVSNAVKFTARGTVTVAARVDATRAWIEVRDSGPGIAPEDMAHLFKPFMQGGEAQRRHREGTGLGLAISRNLARALGGDITVTSQPGQGSTFTVVLPLERAAVPDVGGESGLYRRLALPGQALGKADPAP
ncbi:MAG TPA: ATP-binding protein [Steroidobacteraceae bacterium]|nr:ATP-binding protein [Steroidobacteraceae bacterium]